MNTDAYETIVIGGGQAGLSVGYHLAKRNREFVILDENERVGEAWRRRWDSLRLFTPALQRATRDAVRGAEVVVPDEGRDGRLPRGLCGTLRVAGASWDARRAGRAGGRPVRRVDRRRAARGAKCRRRDRRSTGAEASPFAARLDPRIIQLHSAEYRQPSQLQDGAVLVVGVGNSGAEIAYELAETHRCLLAGVAKVRSRCRTAAAGAV